MIFLITLAITAILYLGVIELQYMNGRGVITRIVTLIFPLVGGCLLIYAGVISPPVLRGALLQGGAAILTAILICVAYIVYKNKNGWGW